MIDLRKAKKQKDKKSFRTVSSVRKRPPVISKDYPPQKKPSFMFFFSGGRGWCFYVLRYKSKKKKKKKRLAFALYIDTYGYRSPIMQSKFRDCGLISYRRGHLSYLLPNHPPPPTNPPFPKTNDPIFALDDNA